MSFQRAQISCRRCSVLAHILLVGEGSASLAKYVGKHVAEATEKKTSSDPKFYEARYQTLMALEQVFYHPSTPENERQLATRCLDACVGCGFSEPQVCAMIAGRKEEAPHN